MKQLLKDWFTEKDGISACPVRAGFIIGFMVILGLTLNDLLCNGTHFLGHAKDWMTGLAEYLGLGGAAVAGKNMTEKAE